MPPKVANKVQPPPVVYPSGVKEITDDLGTDEMIRRLKTCAQAFQNMGQDDDNSQFIPLAKHLAKESFIEHSNKDVRLLIACCVADVFRVYAPEAPYKEPAQLKNIFLFFIKQLKGLADPKDPSFKRYFYLLENLAWVKSFNICIELEDNQEIFCKLFTLMFSIVNDDHSAKVKNFMLDMMAPLISEADSVSQELLDIILAYIIEPRKSQNRNAYCLARDLLKKTSSTIEPYIQNFFNNALVLGKTSESDVTAHLYELIYELNSISPGVLLAVYPQLEFKLKSNDEKERLEVSRLLARMFSDKNSELAHQHKLLWQCFLGRFNDISVSVRNRCVQYSMHFLLNHPELREDITEQLKHRQHDPEETVRYEVVMAIISAAKRDFTSINDQLLEFVKERALDKKFKIRKEALIGLSVIYKKCMNTPNIPESTIKCISWIKSKVMHVYYQTALDDRLLVERILHTCLVPYQLPHEDRMKKLYHLYATIDDYAVKAFNELLKCQNIVRNHVRGLLELHTEQRTEEIETQISQKINVLAKSLPDPVKAQEFLKKLDQLIQSDSRVRTHLEVIMKPDCMCKEADENVRELLKKLGNPVMTNVFYMTVKQLLERVAPVLIDKNAIQILVTCVEKVMNNDTAMLEEVDSPKALERGLRLLHGLAIVFPAAFYNEEVYKKLATFLKADHELVAEITLQILPSIGANIENEHPETFQVLVPVLRQFAVEGTNKQAKYAVHCLDVILSGSTRDAIFTSITEELKNNLNLECPHFCTALVSIGHIARRAPTLCPYLTKGIITKNIVQELIMQDKEIPRETDANWCSEEILSVETRAKIEGMKLMVRWLLGLKNHPKSGSSALRLFTSIAESNGDLLKQGKISRPEMAWLRVNAGCCALKLVQDPTYAETLTNEQFQILSRLIVDETINVRERFAQKLHKGLITLKLPLEFMAIFCLGTSESNRDLKNRLHQYLTSNINKRRDYLKQQPFGAANMKLHYPDYIIPYAIHLLAHHPDFKKFDQVNVLYYLKDCLWFFMEPLIKNETFSFGFFKKLIENIKQTKDAQNPDDEMQNMKLWAVCDLALGLVLSKTSNFVLKEFPLNPTLPSKLFTEMDDETINSKIFLPPELACMYPKGLSLDADHSKTKTNVIPVAKRTRLKTSNTSGSQDVSTVSVVSGFGDQQLIDPNNATGNQVNALIDGETLIVQEIIEDATIVEGHEIPVGDVIYITAAPTADGVVEETAEEQTVSMEVVTEAGEITSVKEAVSQPEPRVRQPRKQQLKVSQAIEEDPLPKILEDDNQMEIIEIDEDELPQAEEEEDDDDETEESSESGGRKRRKRSAPAKSDAASTSTVTTRSKRFAASRPAETPESNKPKPAGRKRQSSDDNSKAKDESDETASPAGNTRRNLRRNSNLSNGASSTESPTDSGESQRKSARVQQRNSKSSVAAAKNVQRRAK
ncbi:hypothetical protein CHUAL_013897 [Chamberlinius hualienensis]